MGRSSAQDRLYMTIMLYMAITGGSHICTPMI